MKNVDDAVLDDLLESKRPALAPRTDELAALLAEVSADPFDRRTRWRVGAVVALGVMLAGGATAAVASPSVREWLGWTPDWTVEWEASTGEACVASFLIDYQQFRDGQSRSRDEVYALAINEIRQLDLSPRGILSAVDERRVEIESNDVAWDDSWLELPAVEFEEFAVQQLMVDTLSEAFAAESVFIRELRINTECSGAAQ